MQFLSEQRYIAVVVAGTVQSCGAAPGNLKAKQDEHEDECRDRFATVTLQRRRQPSDGEWVESNKGLGEVQ
jgi:hypothetical protein